MMKKKRKHYIFIVSKMAKRKRAAGVWGNSLDRVVRVPLYIRHTNSLVRRIANLEHV